jgi:organic radical activating enzyme
MKEIVSKTYCPLPFNHLYVHPTNMASVCCVFRKETENDNLPNIKEYKNLGDHLNHPFIKDIQQKMLKGEEVEGCSSCYYAEEHGYQSFREREIETWHIETFRDFTPPDLENPKLEYMEMTFGNYCNLACRTCDSNLSHSWIKDENELEKRGLMELKDAISYDFPITDDDDTSISLIRTGMTKRINIEKEWHPDDFKDLQYIKITGGEPMLHPDFPKFMKQLQQENIHCFIFTNASWVPKQRVFDMMKNFKFLSVFMSVDGTGDVQEYMRHNSKWETTNKSVRAWMDWSVISSNVNVSWAPTWSLMNAPYFVETCNWWLGLTEEILRDTSWNLLKTNFIYGPSIYQMSLLPTETKEKLKIQALEYIEELKNKDIAGKEHIIDMTEAYIKFFDNDNKKEGDLEYYHLMTDALDDMRGQSLKKMLPLTYKAMYEIEKK